MFFLAGSVWLFFYLTFLSSCLKWELMLCFRKLHTLSPFQRVHFWSVFSVCCEHLAWPPRTFGLATVNICISHNLVVPGLLPCPCLPVLRVGNCGNCSIFLGRQFLLNVSWKVVEAQRFLFFFLFLKGSVEKAWKRLFPMFHRGQVPLSTGSGWNFSGGLYNLDGATQGFSQWVWPHCVVALGADPWQSQSAALALWNLHRFEKWRWPNVFSVAETSCMTGRAKLLCNPGWIHVGRFSGLKCSLLLLKLSCRYSVVFCAFFEVQCFGFRAFPCR